MLVLRGQRCAVERLAFAPDGRTLAARSGYGVQLWRDLADGCRPERIDRRPPVDWFAFAPCGRLYLDGHATGVYDPATRRFTPIPNPGGIGRTLAPSADGRAVYTSWPPAGHGGVGRLEAWPADAVGVGPPMWSVPTVRERPSRPHPLPDGRFLVLEVDYRPRRPVEGSCVIRAGGDGRVLRPPREFVCWPESMPVILDDRWLAVTDGDAVTVCSLADPDRPPVTASIGSGQPVTGLAVHPTGRVVAASGADGTVRLFDTETWAVARTFDWGIGKMTSVAFSPDGLLAAAGSHTGRIAVWDFDG